jgi:hypothetical protein
MSSLVHNWNIWVTYKTDEATTAVGTADKYGESVCVWGGGRGRVTVAHTVPPLKAELRGIEKVLLSPVIESFLWDWRSVDLWNDFPMSPSSEWLNFDALATFCCQSHKQRRAFFICIIGELRRGWRASKCSFNWNFEVLTEMTIKCSGTWCFVLWYKLFIRFGGTYWLRL